MYSRELDSEEEKEEELKLLKLELLVETPPQIMSS
jgi:hypothetical protein